MSEETEKLKIIHFQNSILFEIEQIAKLIHTQSKDFFEKNNIEITHEEFRAIDVLYCNPDCCQRDLAKLILRDRIYTGRLIDSLEKKGFIERYNDTKGKRLVKKMIITEAGLECYKVSIQKMQPEFKKLEAKISAKEIENVKKSLQHIKSCIAEATNIKI